ncbi:MAG: hypothetical protein A3C70_03175 [Candidatus Zambryskibacteria bacterium RIFCSPHIGHO2_02_FULL_43_14]|uniref:Uncharacterized protein n=1 Tax=Candidatus Zambryskibacteria bacterium RIFCSPHIGHO2_02_FULL_43_14 TaxID=1802748 RepID=A0A1G2TEL1_9BACT|nr:MAG: hypothetical protein A3I90_02115 [Candidatus Nomurabacteria bacterium RIFCSPLOWO2_02_FULL_41_9]OHA95745.1 MAG: hypothetical protein A3C70_03175 [Candidatus Zambryskibacteria bacterium RIFCSPHIGHO2_02_FULL_43_14]OHB03026.1 MAG: hypothetical protein A3B03_00365 [Candidatus Zambryskibacteria bacterium RIFCSPLOWO2_01_FULL_42_41]
MKYLKPKQHYLDLYDRHTVKSCRDLIGIYSVPSENLPLYQGKPAPKELVDSVGKMALEWSLMFEKGNRFLKKEEVVEKWMTEDAEKDRFYEAAEPPYGIRCLTCQKEMALVHKDLWTELNKPLHVLFMYDCPNGCRPGRMFWDNSEEWTPKPHLCPKCSGKLKLKDRTTDKKFITDYLCASCGFTKTEELERTVHSQEESDPDFEFNRTRFCLSKEEGEKWRQELANMEEMKKLVDKWKEKDKHKTEYDAINNLKKLTVVALENLLAPLCEKAQYIKFQLGTADIGKDLTVPFTVHEANPDRADLASSHALQKIVKNALAGTNWRLMSDGISYRMGILTGRLRAYEREEDLLKLVQKAVGNSSSQPPESKLGYL